MEDDGGREISGSEFRFWVMRWVRIGFAASSGVERPRPMTSKLSLSSAVVEAFRGVSATEGFASE